VEQEGVCVCGMGEGPHRQPGSRPLASGHGALAAWVRVVAAPP
jgi:hypothetical protein